MLPKGWTSTTLGDCQGRTSTIDPSSFKGEVFDLYSVPSHSEGMPEVVAGKDIGSIKQEVQAGDVLLCKIVPHIRRSWVVTKREKGRRQIASGEWMVMRDHGLEPEYLRRFVLSDGFHAQFMQTVSGVGGSLMRARPAEAGKITLPLPPLAEQRRIVAKLDALTARLARARADLKRVPVNADRMRAGILSQAFDGKLSDEWRNAHPKCAPVIPRRNDELRPKYRTQVSNLEPYSLPSAWRWLRLPELGDIDRGKSRHRPRNASSLFGGTHPFIQTGDVRSAGQYLTKFETTYNDFGLAQSRKWNAGTVCITIAANIAESTILGIDACFPDSIVGFSPDQERTKSEYIEFFIRTAKQDLERFAPATAQKNINLDTLASISVPVPPLSEQSEIVARIETVFARADRLEAEAARAKELLDRLEAAFMAKAFRGELVPQDPADEPASVLLDRIRAERAATPRAKRGRRSAPA